MSITPSRTLRRSHAVVDLMSALAKEEQKVICERIEKENKVNEAAKKTLRNQK